MHIYWPVPDGSGLMQDPSIEQLQSPGVKQPVSLGDKGRCNRIGVSVDRSKGLSIGAALGFKLVSNGRGSRSLPAALFGEGQGKAVAPLIVLDKFSCGALNVTGNGGVDALANGDTPGMIAVDSNGSTNCNGANTYTIEVTNNSHIRAWDTVNGGGGDALILTKALGENPSESHDPLATGTNCQPSPGVFNSAFIPCPTPKDEGRRIGRDAFDVRYNCPGVCNTPNSDDINQFKQYVGYTNVATNAYSPGPNMTTIPGGPIAMTNINNACDLPTTNATITTDAVTTSWGSVREMSGSRWLSCTQGSAVITVGNGAGPSTTVIDGPPVRSCASMQRHWSCRPVKRCW